TGVELHVDTDLREFHEIGLRHASSLHPGNIHIWGTIDRAYVNGALLYLLLGRGASPNNIAEPYPQPALAMNLVFQNPAVPGHRSVIDVLNIKFENWGLRMPEDEFVMEKVRFRALRVDVRDQEGTEMRVPSFPAASLSAEDLLAGGALTHEVELPAGLLAEAGRAARVVVRPLTVRDLQRIA